MCPLLECLITAYEGLKKYLAKFNMEFFTQLKPSEVNLVTSLVRSEMKAN